MSVVPTRSGERERPTSGSGAKPLLAGAHSIREPSEDGTSDLGAVLHAEEVQRARVFFRIILALATLTGAAIPLLTGERWLRALAILLCGITAIISAVLLVLLRDPKRYTARLSTVVGGLFAVMGVAVIYYIGLFSAGAMILVVGIYFFGLSHSRATARVTYGIVATLYLVASVGLASGLLVDRSLFSTENAVPFSRWFQVVMSQLIFAFTFYLARSSRRALEGAIETVRRQNVQIQKRDALLMEAQGELAQVRRPAQGRHTGTRVDGFRIGDVIGRGAMGEVYKGTDPAGLPVAIKLLHPNLVDDARKVKRFMKEAEVAAAVDSDHVPRVYGSGWVDDDTPFLAMDLLEGHDLSWHLRKTGRLQPPLVVEMVEQVAKALADVREAGVVHRDLKPSNIYLIDSLPRRWKVLDFGLSKLMWDTGSLTKDHAVGTPAYMAPEQVMGPRVDHLADLYALTALAYRALTGVPPFSGSEVGHVLYRVCYQQPTSPADLCTLPVDLELVLAVGLAKDPKERFANVEELAAAFRAAFDGHLDDDVRARGWALLKERPWGSKTRPDAA